MRLFDLSDEILQLEAQLEDESLTDEQRDGLVDKWLEAQGDSAIKIDNYAGWICELEARAETRRFHAERLRTLARSDENRAIHRRSRLKLYFERHNIERFQTARFNLLLQGNGGQRPIIIDVSPMDLPPPYHTIFIEPNMAAIRTQLEKLDARKADLAKQLTDGQIDFWEHKKRVAEIEELFSIPGVRFGERGTSLRIK